MKKYVIFAVVALIGVAFYNSLRNENIDTTAYEAGHLDWCESIYHRNVSCPKFGQVTVPAAVQY